VALII